MGTISDIKRQIWIVRTAFQTLGKVWSARDITAATTKLQIYEILVLSCFLYNSETWTVNYSSEQRLNVIEMVSLRILGVTRWDGLHNDDIKKRLHLQKDTTRAGPGGASAML